MTTSTTTNNNNINNTKYNKNNNNNNSKNNINSNINNTLEDIVHPQISSSDILNLYANIPEFFKAFWIKDTVNWAHLKKHTIQPESIN